MCLYKHIYMSSSIEDVALLIKKAQHRHHRWMDAELAALGLSLVQWNALREIQRNAGASMHQLAELTFNSDQAFGTLTTRLLRSGLIERIPGPGRVSHHRLTPKGEMLLRDGGKLVQAVFAKSFAPLSTEERDALATLLAKLLS